ncbi:MAG TPA: prepilin-type N-terminal cleavage/methylation domain-containing protein [Candidatus Saccharimonadales bacterium]|nr:prepilin-type N-terminal cleavage/methylation domain-containing protein [Candidatus Saccharimonadales bacterium]
MQKTKSGFTIVELLIVIVVIGILAAITIVTYSGVQDRAVDTRMRVAANKVEKALRLWHIDTGESPQGGWASTLPISGNNCPDGDVVNGWVATDTYPCTLEDILVAGDYLSEDFIGGLPSNTYQHTSTQSGRYSMMFYPCNETDEFALYWTLRAPSVEDGTQLQAVLDDGCPTAPETTHGMRGAKIIQL